MSTSHSPAGGSRRPDSPTPALKAADDRATSPLTGTVFLLAITVLLAGAVAIAAGSLSLESTGTELAMRSTSAR